MKYTSDNIETLNAISKVLSDNREEINDILNTEFNEGGILRYTLRKFNTIEEFNVSKHCRGDTAIYAATGNTVETIIVDILSEEFEVVTTNSKGDITINGLDIEIKTSSNITYFAGSTHSTNNKPDTYIVVYYNMNKDEPWRSGKVIDGFTIMLGTNVSNTEFRGKPSPNRSFTNYGITNEMTETARFGDETNWTNVSGGFRTSVKYIKMTY